MAASLRGSPGIALGDVVGANVAICLVAHGVGAWITPLPFRAGVMRYALLGLPLGAVGAWFAWDGEVGHIEGTILVALHALYVAVIWRMERRPPALGEVGELVEAQDAAAAGHTSRFGRDFLAFPNRPSCTRQGIGGLDALRGANDRRLAARGDRVALVDAGVRQAAVRKRVGHDPTLCGPGHRHPCVVGPGSACLCRSTRKHRRCKDVR